MQVGLPGPVVPSSSCGRTACAQRPRHASGPRVVVVPGPSGTRRRGPTWVRPTRWEVGVCARSRADILAASVPTPPGVRGTTTSVPGTGSPTTQRPRPRKPLRQMPETLPVLGTAGTPARVSSGCPARVTAPLPTGPMAVPVFRPRGPTSVGAGTRQSVTSGPGSTEEHPEPPESVAGTVAALAPPPRRWVPGPGREGDVVPLAGCRRGRDVVAGTVAVVVARLTSRRRAVPGVAGKGGVATVVTDTLGRRAVAPVAVAEEAGTEVLALTPTEGSAGVGVGVQGVLLPVSTHVSTCREMSNARKTHIYTCREMSNVPVLYDLSTRVGSSRVWVCRHLPNV